MTQPTSPRPGSGNAAAPAQALAASSDPARALAPRDTACGHAVAVHAELTADEQQRLVRAWAAELRHRHGQAPRHIETHISHVLLAGGLAYKIKKAIRTSFLDQSTLARRRQACAEELRLNRRLAPELYLGVVELTGTPEVPTLGGPGPVLDVAVNMRAFDEGGLWDRLATQGALGASDIDDLAQRLARFHAEAAVAGPASVSSRGCGTPGAAREALQDTLRDLRAQAAAAGWPDATGLAALDRLVTWEAMAFARTEAAMARRLAGGRVRECHGDLHLGNVAREGGRCLIFDGIEFNDRFRWLDVMDEVAFMAMDLHAHGLRRLAHRFTNAYLENSGDYDGARVLGYYLVHRALVRAKVAQIRALQAAEPERAQALESAARYFALALHLAEARPRALIICHGLSGSGKTTLTQDLLETAGLLRVRADVERKRLAGLGPLQSSHSVPGAGLYTEAMNEATLARLLQAAADGVEGGWAVIVDATFIRRSARAAARQCAGGLGVPFFILRFGTNAAVLRERLRQRTARASDASEADETVLAAQVRALEPLLPDELAQALDVQPLPTASDSGAMPQADWRPLLSRLAAGQPRPDEARQGTQPLASEPGEPLSRRP